MDTGEEKEHGVNWDSIINIHTLPCIKKIASGKLLYSTGSSAWCSMITYMGGMGSGREVQEEGIYVYL